MDIWDKKKRSTVMAKIKSKDTKPELLVRRHLYHRGYRYRKNVRGLPGTPDIVLRKYGVAIFVHGCFWHGHETDGHIPRTRSAFWEQKIKRNQQRDKRSKEALKGMGWDVITIWECQLKPNIREQTLREVEYWINHAYLKRLKPKAYPTATPYPEEEGGTARAAEDGIIYKKSEPLNIVEQTDQ